MKYYIAIDSGGNKTDSVLFDQTGRVIARDKRRGANAFDTSPAEASARLNSAIDVLRASLPEGEKVASIFGAVASVTYYPEILRRAKRIAEGAIVNFDEDVIAIMAAAFGREDGVCVICGTGSSVQVREAGKPLHRIGGSGMLLDTGGSGFILGRAALVSSQYDRDGRGEKTLMSKIVEQEMGETLVNHLPVIYAGGRAYVAGFAHAVFQAREKHDPLACRVFNKGVEYFVQALEAAKKHMGKPFKAALGGGIFANYPEYVEAICENAPEGCELINVQEPPVYGAALEALWQAGDEPTEDFKENFLKTYREKCED
ncbi:MAG: hypothetical protein IKW00_02415 [Clostridia bacterium]|nr:hypothetical protein [Clostridia bacterium]